MSMVRWDPFSDSDAFFNRMMSRGLTGWPRMQPGGDGGSTVEWTPSADISETDREYLIRAELPAVRKEDVKVTVDGDGVLTVHLPKSKATPSKPVEIKVQ